MRAGRSLGTGFGISSETEPNRIGSRGADEGMTGPDNTVLKETMAACRGGFIAVFVFGLGINLLMLATPLYMLQVFDRVLSSSSIDTLVMLSLVVVIALVALAALDAVRGFVLVSISTWLERRISGTVLEGSVAATLRRGDGPSIQGLRDLSMFRSFLSGPLREVTCLAFFPDGARLASGSDDGTGRIWDLATREVMHTVRGHAGQVGAMAISADGRRLATGDVEGVVRIWDGASGGLLA